MLTILGFGMIVGCTNGTSVRIVDIDYTFSSRDCSLSPDGERVLIFGTDLPDEGGETLSGLMDWRLTNLSDGKTTITFHRNGSQHIADLRWSDDGNLIAFWKKDFATFGISVYSPDSEKPLFSFEVSTQIAQGFDSESFAGLVRQSSTGNFVLLFAGEYVDTSLTQLITVFIFNDQGNLLKTVATEIPAAQESDSFGPLRQTVEINDAGILRFLGEDTNKGYGYKDYLFDCQTETVIETGSYRYIYSAGDGYYGMNIDEEKWSVSRFEISNGKVSEETQIINQDAFTQRLEFEHRDSFAVNTENGEIFIGSLFERDEAGELLSWDYWIYRVSADGKILDHYKHRGYFVSDPIIGTDSGGKAVILHYSGE